MNRLALLILLFLQTWGSAFAQSATCSCDREQLLKNVRNASTIFYGLIREARMESRASDTIQLAVEIRDPIRGPKSGILELSTTLPHKCGVNATIGHHALYVVESETNVVTRCGGSGRHYYQKGHELYDLHNLTRALIVIEYAESNPRIVQSWLNRSFGKNHTRRDQADRLFALIGELDTENVMTITDGEVIYRDIVFVFTDDILVDYFWRAES